jgi:hypothetical protein
LATAVGKSPKLDTRDSEAIMQQVRSLAPFYTPEWNSAEENGAGATLLKIVARLLEGIIRRLNDVPLKHFIAFLESIGIKLLPALPARTPLTFFLSSGAKEAVSIPAGSQVAANPPGAPEPIIFETEKTILATPAKLTAIASVVPALDRIVDHTAPLAGGGITELFSEQETNLQSHILYLAHDDLFNVKGAARFKLEFGPQVDLADENSLLWEYYAGEKETTVAGVKQKSLDWRALLFKPISGNGLQLDKIDGNEIKQVKINGVNSRWIRCRVKATATTQLLKSDALANLAVENVKIFVSPLTASGASDLGVDPDAAFYNDLPLALPPEIKKPLTPFGPTPETNPDGSIAGTRPRPGDVFYLASQDAFSKLGSTIWIGVGALPPGAVGLDVERVQGIGPIRAPLFRDKGINTVFQLLRLSAEEIAKIIDEKNPKVPRSINIREAAVDTFLDKVVTSGPAVIEKDKTRIVPTLSWEYWNGNGWVRINRLEDATNALTAPGIVKFDCPQDMAMTKVVGQENFWIRARIAFGDYGQERVTFKVVQKTPPDPNENTVKMDVSGIRPPEITSLKIDYYQEKEKGESPQYCLTLNNLAYSWQLVPSSDQPASFSPFVALDDDSQSLYLGFDQAPLKGPISIFFSLQEQEYTEKNRPRIEWQYFRQQKGRTAGEWVRLAATDGTRNLTQSGTIEFIGPADFAQVGRFGRNLFWIRAVDSAAKFTPKIPPPDTGKLDGPPSTDAGERNQTGSQAESASVEPGKGDKPDSKCPECPGHAATAALPACEQVMDSLMSIVKFPAQPTDLPLAPILRGVYLNTAWGIQAETIQDELLGSSDGSANQKFNLTKSPVIEESIWVNELATLTETERKAFTERIDLDVRIKKDAEDNVVEFLVRWRPIDDMAQANPADRAYVSDRTFGLVMFGDGAKHGLVPPIGRDNIKATYRTGGGSRGNVAATMVKSLRSTIPFVESVSNPEAAGGGSDTEPVERALERGPQVLKNRDRAIAAEDFEWLARAASQAIERAKCLPTFNDQGKYETGWVTVIIVPSSSDARPLPSPQLRQRVEKYLLDHSANVASSPLHIKVIPPAYVAVKVLADVYPLSIDLAPQVEARVIAALQKFLHPLNGGYQNVGWDFGRVPCLSDFYALLETIDGVDHVDSLSLTLQSTTLLGEVEGDPVLVNEERPLDVAAPPFTLVYSGEHKITIKGPIPMLG